jgi:Alpha/beta hydrolase of unknown function (DUF900)
MTRITYVNLALMAISASLIISIQSALAYDNYISDNSISPIYVVNTRFNIPPTMPSQPPLDMNQQAIFALWKFGAGCPPEIVIYVHGYNKDDAEAKEEFHRIQKSFAANGYRIPLIGISWSSKTYYSDAQTNAGINGPLLADFVKSFKNECPNTEIRIVTHSLGASVADSTIVSLDRDSKHGSNDTGIIKSVHLLGAAISNQSIANNSLLGNATEHVAEKLYNFYDPEDDGLEFNEIFENHFPLGLEGVSVGNRSLNYNETNVAYEIPPFPDADGDGNIEECFEEIRPVKGWGDNHCGYIGFRQPSAIDILDDGVINLVVRDWIRN